MANHTKNQRSERKNGVENKTAAPFSEPVVTQQQLPPYKPINFAASPSHLDVLSKKIRATKKKLREIEKIEKKPQSVLNPEQQQRLAEKATLTRALRDFEEIEKSLQNLDLTVQLRLLLGVFFAAAHTNSEALTGLSVLLLPPSDPQPGYNPLKEIQHASEIAEKFIQGDQSEVFSSPPTTYAQLKEEVVNFLSTEESKLIIPIPVTEKPVSATPTVAEVATPNKPETPTTTTTTTKDEAVKHDTALPADSTTIITTITNNTDDPKPVSAEGTQDHKDFEETQKNGRKRQRGAKGGQKDRDNKEPRNGELNSPSHRNSPNRNRAGNDGQRVENAEVNSNNNKNNNNNNTPNNTRKPRDQQKGNDQQRTGDQPKGDQRRRNNRSQRGGFNKSQSRGGKAPSSPADSSPATNNATQD